MARPKKTAVKKPNIKKKSRAGRPSLFSVKIQNQIKSLALKGLTDKVIAQGVGVTEQTLNNWKIKHPKFFEALKDWKIQADMEVEASLRKRACGYIGEDGREYPPDPTSMIFWLKNRQPAQWRDKQDINHGGNVTITAPPVSKPKGAGE